jgi:hypothetical protein
MLSSSAELRLVYSADVGLAELAACLLSFGTGLVNCFVVIAGAA